MTTRRHFLAGVGVVAAGTAAACAPPPPKPPPREKPPPRKKKPPPDAVLFLSLYGGNDGLNTVIPYQNAKYAAKRGSLAITSGYHPIGEGHALHPMLGGLKRLWDRDLLAVIHGVSYPSPSLSHFRSMDIWQTGSTSSNLSATGWLGRWLDGLDGDPLHAVTLSSTLPRMLRGASRSAMVVPNTTTFSFPGTAAVKTGFGTMAGTEAFDPAPMGQLLTKVNRSFTAGQSAIASALATGNRPANLAALQNNPLSLRLENIVRMVRAGLPTKVYEVSLGGFDTHISQLAAQNRQLGYVDDALTAFHADCDALKLRVPAVTWSEFGRRVAPNNQGGSDHGTAGVVLVSGPTVVGGHYGDIPSLTKLTNYGDLIGTTDFRSVYTTILRRVLKTDPGSVLSGDHPGLAFIRK